MNKESEGKVSTWTFKVAYANDVDWIMTLFLRRIIGKKRRQRFFKEVSDYRDRVVERQRQKDLKTLAFHTGIPLEVLQGYLNAKPFEDIGLEVPASTGGDG